MKIAVYGKLRAGKTAVCEYIKENCWDYDILDFGDALKECIAIAYPETVGKPKNRELLIAVGQHMRKLDEDVWVNALKHRVNNSPCENILVTGVRQQNEYDMLKKEGFIFIEVRASKESRIARCVSNGDIFNVDLLEDHTEVVMDGFEPDYVIENERGFKELEISIRNILADLIVKELNNNPAKFISGERGQGD